MDILGPFPPASGQRKFLLVAIDYFTKWVEAEPLAQITEGKVESFVKNSTIFRFGIPHVIITDNGRQFDNPKFKDFCARYHIQHRLTSVAHPQSNGEAEVTNRTILHGLKTRLNAAKGLWAEELTSVLWAYRTTPRTAIDESPFNLAYGTEAVLPIEVSLQSLRIDNYEEPENSDRRRIDLDLLSSTRLQAQIRMAAYQQKVAKYYNARVKEQTFRTGDMVLRRAEVSRPMEQGKLSPNWEGPYQVEEVIRPGTYRLKTLEGKTLSRPWNVQNLRKYY